VNVFIPGGPKRYAHQTRGLKKLIDVAGVGALLFDPGLGKTATTLDFMSILAMKIQPDDNGVREARVLVICPLAAVDTWVKEAPKWASPQINFWAEAVSGTIVQRAMTLAARGGSPFGPRSQQNLLKLTKPPGKRFRLVNGVRTEEPVRAYGWQKSIDQSARSDAREVLASDGPDGLGTNKPRLIIEVLNFDTFASRQRHGSRTSADIVLEGVKRFAPDLIVIDESHKIKGATSNVSKLMDRIGPTVKRRIMLTGTVMPSGPMDVFAQWRFLDPYAFGDVQPDGTVKKATRDSFQGRYAQMGGFMGHDVVGYRNLDEMQNIMARRAVVARKQDELDLPPVKEIIVPVMLSPAEKQAYQDMKKDLSVQLLSGGTASVTNRLTQMMRLRQITSGHLPDDLGNARVIGTSKIDTLRSIAHDTLAGEKRIVVFCLFVHEFHALVKAMAQPGTLVMGISGETESADRLKMREVFGDRNDKRRIILVAQIKTMSIAVNELVTASNVLFGSLSQQRDDLIQGIDRLNRIGQIGGQVNVWFAEAPGTIDTVIHQSHNDRTNLEGAVLKHILGDAVDTFDALQARPEQAMSEAGSLDTHSHAEAVEVSDETVPISDERFPGATSMTADQIADAVGTFHGGQDADDV
jgi:SNF2 family DNA or RNA helicase